MAKIAFVFPGQGAQYPGMAKEFVENFSEADAIFKQASESLGYDMKELCFNGTEEDLKKTENTQPAILTASIAIYEVLKAKGLKAEATAGLSLGEYSALVAAGALKFDEAVSVVQKRGRFMQEEVPQGVGAMAAILGLENDLVVEACTKASSEGIVEPANFNCPMQLVIGGEVKAVEKAVEYCKASGAKKAVMLPVSAPFHTSLLNGAGEKLKPQLESMTLSDCIIPVINNVDAAYMTSASQVVDKLVRQVSNPVRWEDCIKQLTEDGFDTFIEIGPGSALSKFIKKISKDAVVMNVEDLQSMNKTLEKLGEL